MTESQVQIAEQFCRYDRTNPNARLIDAIGHEDSLVNHLRDQADEIAVVEDDRIYKTCAYNEDVRPCETVVTPSRFVCGCLKGRLKRCGKWTHLRRIVLSGKDGGCGYISYYRDHYFYMWGSEARKRLLKERRRLEEQLVTLRRDMEFMEQRAEAGDLRVASQ